MPFISEEVYHKLRERNDGIYALENMYFLKNFDPLILEYGSWLKKAISAILDAKNKNLKPKDEITLYIDASDITFNPQGFDDILKDK